MNKKFIGIIVAIVIVVAVLIIAGVGCFLFLRNRGSVEINNNMQNEKS